MEVRGRNLVEGIPQTITVTDDEVRQALDPAVSSIVDAVRVALERTPPELSADIIDRGVVLTGGGALLANLDKRLANRNWSAGVRRGRSADVSRAWRRQDAFRLRVAEASEVGKHAAVLILNRVICVECGSPCSNPKSRRQRAEVIIMLLAKLYVVLELSPDTCPLCHKALSHDTECPIYSRLVHAQP